MTSLPDAALTLIASVALITPLALPKPALASADDSAAALSPAEEAPAFSPASTLEETPTEKAVEATSPLRLTDMRVQGAWITYGEGSRSIELSWNPSYGLTHFLSARANLGASIRRTDQGSSFLLLDTRAILSADRILGGLGVALGAGAQTWISSNGGTFFTASIDLPWEFENPPFGWLRSVFVGYAQIHTPSTSTLWRGGVEIGF